MKTIEQVGELTTSLEIIAFCIVNDLGEMDVRFKDLLEQAKKVHSACLELRRQTASARELKVGN